MSETTNNATQPAARVIIELSATGVLTMENYVNGQRQRQTLTRGDEWWQILDELRMQKQRIETAAERKLERDGEVARRRHREVWINTAENHGISFAKQKIKGPVPMGYGQYFAKDDKPKSQKNETTAPVAIPPAEDFL